jgi:asparagine synthase (glutamine-hydrolysing)
MCGIAGFIDFNGLSSKQDLSKMIKSLHHRGPDDSGTEVHSIGNSLVGLGHARLSVIDLTPGGHQPMTRKHLSIVFNGEIYNYKEVRQKLLRKGYSFSSDSDTEVILHSYAEWGANCVDYFIGMFAFVITDTKEQKCFLFRDRAGVKPLYCYWNEGLFLFASELKAFHVHPQFKKEESQNVLRNYFDLGYIPSHQSIFRHVFKLQPGQYCTIDLNSSKQIFTTYWDAAKFYEKPKLDIDYLEAKEHLHSLLKSACDYRMVSDVPVGIFLSGGYDSTAVAAILQRESSKKLNTFTIGFEHGNNEAPFASETAKYLGTDHHELTCTSKEAQSIIPELPFHFDEPFADSSAIPTFLVSQFAKKHVTVALSADGGDELLAGYSRYEQLRQYSAKLENKSRLLSPFLKLGAPIVGAIQGSHRSYQMETVAHAIKLNDPVSRDAFLYDRMHRMPDLIYDDLFNQNINDKDPIQGWNLTDIKDYPLLHDYKNYLPGDILTKVDRATMSVGLEGREPLLDHRILEFVAQLPYDYKANNGIGKIMLRDIVHEYIPKKMMDRPKSGFSIPLTQWFQTDLKELLFDTLLKDDDSLIFNKGAIEKILNDFVGGKLHYKPLVWKLLMFRLWQNKWINR